MNTPDAFWANVDSTGGDDACWPWTKGTNRSGYGFVKWDGACRYAHRVAYELYSLLPLDPDVVLLHLCDNPPCCNPHHLQPGTHRDNRADCVAKQRQAAGERNGRAKLTAADVSNIRMWWERGLVTQGDLARLFHVTRRCIRFILRGEHWKGAIVKINQAELARIASEMKQEIGERPNGTGMAQRILGDVCLVLFYRSDSLRLHVGLRDRWPDLESTLPFARAFGCPAEDQEPRAETLRLESRVGARAAIKTMRYAWMEHLAPADAPMRPGSQLTFFGAATETANAVAAGL